MGQTDLDRRFDEVAGRLKAGQPSGTTPYGEAPLAADHYLLQKSWDYFRERVRTIEEQWGQILAAKDEQRRAVEAELVGVRDRMIAIEEEAVDLRAFRDEVAGRALDEQHERRRDTELLRQKWEEELAALRRSVEDAEAARDAEKRAREKTEERAKTLVNPLKETIDRLKRDIAQCYTDQSQRQTEWSHIERDVMDQAESWQLKGDLLRSEIERRDQALAAKSEESALRGKESMDLTRRLAEATAALGEKDAQIAELERVGTSLRNQLNDVRALWERERAEWRELWDRSREIVAEERRRNRFHAPEERGSSEKEG